MDIENSISMRPRKRQNIIMQYIKTTDNTKRAELTAQIDKKVQNANVHEQVDILNRLAKMQEHISEKLARLNNLIQKLSAENTSTTSSLSAERKTKIIEHLNKAITRTTGELDRVNELIQKFSPVPVVAV